jgi:hypothetical protein
MSTAASDKGFLKPRFNTDIAPMDAVQTTAKNKVSSLEINYIGGEASVEGTPANAAPFSYKKYDFVGGTVPNATDYPDSIAPIGSTFLRLIVSGNAVTGAEMYLKNKASQWGLVSSPSVVAAAKTAAYTVLNTDRLVLTNTAGGALTATLPPIATAQGQIVTFKQVGTGTNALTIDGSGSETIDGAANIATLNAQYDTITLMAGPSEWHVIGMNIA